MSFASLGLSAPLVDALAARDCRVPTPIQAASIPAVLQGRDVLGAARTGSGKTAAFAAPIIQQWVDRGATETLRPGRGADLRRMPKALILTPTRELAVQVGQWLNTLARLVPSGPRVAVVFGGVSINPQMMALRGGADIVVATPGRLLDLVEHNAVSLGSVTTLVLDEADRLLDLGFADELARVVALLPQRRQNLFFSATLPKAVSALADTLLNEPVRIEVQALPQAHADITQRAIQVDPGRRTQLLRHLISQDSSWDRVLVFVATQYSAGLVADKLRRAGLPATELHAQLSQGARTQALADFKAGHVQVLVATDLAARGIDIDQLPVVVNYDLPRSAVDHVHRIGRTGRAGQAGLAVSFISADTEAHFRLIEKRQRLRVPRERVEGFEPVELASAAAASGEGGIKGKRKSKKDKLREAAAAAGKD